MSHIAAACAASTLELNETRVRLDRAQRQAEDFQRRFLQVSCPTQGAVQHPLMDHFREHSPPGSIPPRTLPTQKPHQVQEALTEGASVGEHDGERGP